MKHTFNTMFNEGWLYEAPMNTGYSAHNPYEDLCNSIKANIDLGYQPITVSGNLKSLTTDDAIIYWVESNNAVDIACQFLIKPNGLFVQVTGKRQGSNIYASDFYKMILKDAGKLIFSGDMISSQGFGIWKRLLDSGNKLFIFNTDNALDRATIETEEDLLRYFQGSTDYKKYRFVLSESAKEHFSVTSRFDLLRTYFLTHGIDLFGNKTRKE